MPASESTLCYFVSFLATAKLKHQTIKCYLSAVRHLHITEGHNDPFKVDLPRLHYVLRGIKRSQGEEGVNRDRVHLPITPSILAQLFKVWSPSSTKYKETMLWAAACVGFFGFLRSGEFTVPSSDAYDPSVHLSFHDIAVNSHSAPSLVRLRLKTSKTDPFRQGVDIFLGRGSKELCPVLALTHFLALRGSKPGPLFCWANGAPLTKPNLISSLRSALELAGHDPSKFAGHSFRVGAASTAAERGIEDSVIKVLGRWNSDAYCRYIKLPASELVAYSRVLS